MFGPNRLVMKAWLKVRCPIRLIAIIIITTSCSYAASPRTPVSTSMPNPFEVVERFSAKSLSLEHILAFAIGPDDNIYVTDVSQQIAVISPDGDVLRVWGKRGTAPGRFRFVPSVPSEPFDIAARIAVAPDGRVYVIDPGNERIQVFNLMGEFVGLVGSFGHDEDQFIAPGFLAVDHESDLYVGDASLGTLSKFAPDGRFLWRVGGMDSSEIIDPHLATVDAHDRIVLDNVAGEVVYVDGSGHVVDSFQSDGCDVTVDAAGNTYVNAYQNGCDGGLTEVFDREHRLIGSWESDADPLNSPPRFTTSGEAFAIGPDGSLLRVEISLPPE
jgi:sugar lactone lactonase YvrE